MAAPWCRCVVAFVVAAAVVVVECSCSDIDLVEERNLVVVEGEVVVDVSCSVEQLDRWEVVVEGRNKEMGGSKALDLGLNKALGTVVAGSRSEMEVLGSLLD